MAKDKGQRPVHNIVQVAIQYNNNNDNNKNDDNNNNNNNNNNKLVWLNCHDRNLHTTTLVQSKVFAIPLSCTYDQTDMLIKQSKCS